jgi:hypothetical protein
MCDYSLHNVISRPAKVGDRLISTRFCNSITTGFAEIGQPNVAVCLRPGTELKFENQVECKPNWLFDRQRKTGSNMAVFRQINIDKPNMHHDALEFPSGKVVLVNDLRESQFATVLQLPAAPLLVSSEHGRIPILASLG